MSYSEQIKACRAFTMVLIIHGTQKQVRTSKAKSVIDLYKAFIRINSNRQCEFDFKNLLFPSHRATCSELPYRYHGLLPHDCKRPDNIFFWIYLEGYLQHCTQIVIQDTLCTCEGKQALCEINRSKHVKLPIFLDTRAPISELQSNINNLQRKTLN